MSTFAEKVAAAKAAPRPHKDVTVSLDTGGSEERERLIAERDELVLQRATVQKKDQRLSQKVVTPEIDARVGEIDNELAAIEARQREALITLRFYKVPGDEWAELTANHPRRRNAIVDAKYGYDMHAVCRASAIKYGRTMDGETEEVRTEIEWAELWPLLGGAEHAQVCDTIYYLNEWEPADRVERLKNSSEVATASNKK